MRWYNPQIAWVNIWAHTERSVRAKNVLLHQHFFGKYHRSFLRSKGKIARQPFDAEAEEDERRKAENSDYLILELFLEPH